MTGTHCHTDLFNKGGWLIGYLEVEKTVQFEKKKGGDGYMTSRSEKVVVTSLEVVVIHCTFCHVGHSDKSSVVVISKI